MVDLPSNAQGLTMRADQSLKGIALCIGAYGCFTLQDAAMKWIVSDIAVTAALFWRSLGIVVLCLLLGGRTMLREAVQSPVRGLLYARGILALLAWLFYYYAARDLSLAQMTTIYFSAPVMVTVMAAIWLKERVIGLQWLSVGIGFIGVVIASDPRELGSLQPVLLVLIAAALWAVTTILIKKVNGRMTIITQVFIINAAFMILTGPTLPMQANMPDQQAIFFMIAVGLLGGLGQYMLFSSFEHASASVLAPFEYTGLIWAFALGIVIWATWPSASVSFGAILIALSGVIGLWAARRSLS